MSCMWRSPQITYSIWIFLVITINLITKENIIYTNVVKRIKLIVRESIICDAFIDDSKMTNTFQLLA